MVTGEFARASEVYETAEPTPSGVEQATDAAWRRVPIVVRRRR